MDVDLDLSGRRRDDPTPEYARRLRPVTRICAALAGSVVLLAILSWILTRGSGGRPVPGLPPAVPIGLAFLAAVLILLSSRLSSSFLRRALPPPAGLLTGPGGRLAPHRPARPGRLPRPASAPPPRPRGPAAPGGPDHA